MLKQGLALTALLVMAGCASDQGGSQPAASNSAQSQMAAPSAPTSAELAAYAGSHQYPQSEQARNDIRAAALIAGDTIKIYNFGTEAITDADVWVNRAFVRHINAIAPGSSTAINMSHLYNGVGQQFAASGAHVNIVQIEQDHTLQTLMGPAAQ